VSPAPAPTSTVFRPDRVVVGADGEVRHGVVVAVEHGRIAYVGSADGVANLGERTVVDAPGATLMPGMVDAHVHLAYDGAADPRAYRLADVGLSYPALALRAAAHAAETLRWGFTAVRDLHAPGGVVIDLRDAIRAGWVAGPHVVACGRGLSVTGGHMDKGGWGDHVRLRDHVAACDGPEAFRAGVREQVKRGADCIKINLCGGSTRDLAQPYLQEMTDAEVAAAIDEAHRWERPVAAHTSGGPSVAMAVEAGLDSVEHGHWIDERTADLMAARGTTYVPTLLVNERNFEIDRAVLGGSAASWAWVDRARADKWASLERVRRAGAPIAVGTDAGFMLPHGSMSARELELLVQGGLSPLAALEAATSVGARLLGLEGGVVRVGAPADLLLVDGDPTDDVRVLQDRSRLRPYLAGRPVEG
jgi:imidazolonepropionase-like amidohydrolase